MDTIYQELLGENFYGWMKVKMVSVNTTICPNGYVTNQNINFETETELSIHAKTYEAIDDSYIFLNIYKEKVREKIIWGRTEINIPQWVANLWS